MKYTCIIPRQCLKANAKYLIFFLSAYPYKL